MTPRHRVDGDILTVILADAAPERDGPVEDGIVALLDGGACRTLLVDFSDVTLFGSMDITSLMLVYKHCKESGVPMAVCGLSADLARVFRVTALNRLLEIHPTADAARAALRRGDDHSAR